MKAVMHLELIMRRAFRNGDYGILGLLMAFYPMTLFSAWMVVRQDDYDERNYE